MLRNGFWIATLILAAFVPQMRSATGENPLRTPSEAQSATPQSSTQQTANGQQQSDATPQRDSLWDGAGKLADQEKYAEAVAAGQDALQWQKTHVLGNQSKITAMLESIALWQECVGDFASAISSWQEAAPPQASASDRPTWNATRIRLRIESCQRASQTNAKDQERLAKAARLVIQAEKQLKTKDYASALNLASESLEIRTALLGREDYCTSVSQHDVGTAQIDLKQFDKARLTLEECVAMRERVCGLRSATTIASLNNLYIVYSRLDETELARATLEKTAAATKDLYGVKSTKNVEALSRLAEFYSDHGQLSEAEKKYLALLAAQRAVYGEKRLEVAATLKQLGDLYSRTGDFKKSVQNYEDAVHLYQQLSGPDHVDTARVEVQLGKVEYVDDKNNSAYEHLSHAVESLTRQLGESHAETIEAMAFLGDTLAAKGENGHAERLYMRVVDLYSQTVGENSPKTAQALNNLSNFYMDWGDFAKAEACCNRALKTLRSAANVDPVDLVTGIVALATVHTRTNRFAEAEKELEEALQIAQKQPRPSPTMLASIAFALQHVKEKQGKSEEAQNDMQGLQKTLAEDTRISETVKAIVEDKLARSALMNLNFEEALEHAHRVMEIQDKTLPPLHPDRSRVLLTAIVANLGLHHDDEAKQLADRAIAIAGRELDTASIAQSERQQLAFAAGLRQLLELYLSLPVETVSVDEAYTQALFWKGAVQVRQMNKRRGNGQDPALVAEQQKISAQITAMSLQEPDLKERAAWLKQLNELKDRKDKIEADLAYASRDSDAAKRRTAITPEQLRATLPDGTALVDIYQYTHLELNQDEGAPKAAIQQRIVAFVSRRDHPTVRIELGSAEPIDQAIDEWRTKCIFSPDAMRAEPALQLRRLVWEPLQKHLAGCQTVLVSPDANLSRIPIGALPGKEPGTYLVEDVAVGIIPVPQLLPQLLGKEVAQSSAARQRDPSLLLVGNINYDTNGEPSGGSTNVLGADTGSGQLGNFAALPSAAAEIEGLHQLFKQYFGDGKISVLTQSDASEDAFRRNAPLHRWLFVATHGFFAPSSASMSLAAQDNVFGVDGTSSSDLSGVLNGLVFAGVNNGPSPTGDDGIVTAFEVSSYDLRNVELAVLSGCETGLGQISSGEGALGLQRAFQVAGAHTVVASLWSVPDRGTSQLMNRFLENLWDKKLGTLQALREAQLSMMRGEGQAVGDGQATRDRQTTAAVTSTDSATSADSGTRVAPYYWAAFVLSGQWR